MNTSLYSLVMIVVGFEMHWCRIFVDVCRHAKIEGN